MDGARVSSFSQVKRLDLERDLWTCNKGPGNDPDKRVVEKRGLSAFSNL